MIFLKGYKLFNYRGTINLVQDHTNRLGLCDDWYGKDSAIEYLDFKGPQSVIRSPNVTKRKPPDLIKEVNDIMFRHTGLPKFPRWQRKTQNLTHMASCLTTAVILYKLLTNPVVHYVMATLFHFKQLVHFLLVIVGLL